MNFPEEHNMGLMSLILSWDSPKKERRWTGEKEDGLFLETLVSCCCCLHADDTWDFIDTFFMPSVQGLEQC